MSPARPTRRPPPTPNGPTICISATTPRARSPNAGCTRPAAGAGSTWCATPTRMRSWRCTGRARHRRHPRRRNGHDGRRQRSPSMTAQPNRLASGGRIDRRRPLAFRFDGRRYQGHAGDTLASALLANDVNLVGRSYKYHRPRGILGLGAEEPNALVQLGRGNRTEPTLRATQLELFDGLDAPTQTPGPPLRFHPRPGNGLP